MPETTVVLRSAKGSRLTSAEGDANVTNLKNSADMFAGQAGRIRAWPLTLAGEASASSGAFNRVVCYPKPATPTEFDLFENDVNVYGPTTYRNAAWLKLRHGTRASPTAEKSPTMWVQKIINSDRVGFEFGDCGAGYFGVTKMGGTAFSVGVTGNADHVGGTGQTIGVHGRATAQTNNGEAFGGWSYAACITPGVTPISLIGHEINCYRTSGTNIGWQRTAVNPGNIRGLVITIADGATIPGTMAIEIGDQLGASAGWYTGIVNQPGSIHPNAAPSTIGNGEFMRLHGSALVGDRYGGIRIMDGWWQYGLSFAEVPWDQYLNGCAMLFGLRQRTVYGTTPVDGRYTEVDASGNFNFAGMTAIHFNGTKVLGARVPLIGDVTGTLNGAAFDTGAITTVAQLAQIVGAHRYILKQHGLC